MYSLSYWPTDHKRFCITITSAEIKARLSMSIPKHVRAGALIDKLEHQGVRYTHEDHDILAYAFNLTYPCVGRNHFGRTILNPA